ncbi:MAG: CopY family transcriptional regulator [Alphaproteobacteria bacterium]|nr:CopY family transcriptional regulator [Alphaproteobacteria bacterium]
MAGSYNSTDLQILKALWSGERMSAREVHDALSAETGWSYSTTRTLLTRMAEKGFVARNDFHGVAIYSASASRVQVLGSIARELTRGVFDIRGALPASMFADSPHITPEDLAELDAILNAGDSADPTPPEKE